MLPGFARRRFPRPSRPRPAPGSRRRATSRRRSPTPARSGWRSGSTPPTSSTRRSRSASVRTSLSATRPRCGATCTAPSRWRDAPALARAGTRGPRPPLRRAGRRIRPLPCRGAEPRLRGIRLAGRDAGRVLRGPPLRPSPGPAPKRAPRRRADGDDGSSAAFSLCRYNTSDAAYSFCASDSVTDPQWPGCCRHQRRPFPATGISAHAGR